MEKQKIQDLIRLYNEGSINPEQLDELSVCIERGEVDLTELSDLEILNEKLMMVETASPGRELDTRFFAMLAEEKSKLKPKRTWSFNFGTTLMPRLALATILVVIGFSAGYWYPRSTSTTEVDTLTAEVHDLREMVMLSLLEKDQATERLKAVNLTSEMSEASGKVTKALIKTLNNDENVNVRLAAIEALRPYAQVSDVRKSLIESIGQQNSPLVQVALAELMASIQAKSSVKELQKIVEDEKTPADVKKKIEETIQIMI